MRLCKLFLALGIVALVAPPSSLSSPAAAAAAAAAATWPRSHRTRACRTELKIEGDAATKVADAIKKVNEDLKDDVAKLRDRNASQEERTAARKKVAEAQEKALKDVLSDKQMARLQQIRHQQEGLQIFDDAEAAKTLKLTDDQKTKIKEINDGLRKEITDLNPGGGGGGGRNPETLQKIQTLRKDAMSNALKTLTDDQKKALKDMTGKPFEYKPDAGTGRGGRGRGQPAKPRTDF